MKQYTYTVDLKKNKSTHSLRLDFFLAKIYNNLSRSKIKYLIQQGNVQVQNKIIYFPQYILNNKDYVQINIPKTKYTHISAQTLNLDIIFEDQYIIIINKPAGLVIYPDINYPNNTLVNALISHCGNNLLNIGELERPGIIHRLDKNTSGLIIIAKNKKCYQDLIKQFSSCFIKRVYYALVWGVPIIKQGIINKPIVRHPKKRQKMIVAHNGKKAITQYRILTNFNHYLSLIECKLKTGKSHQIRAHMESIKHPIFADPYYGKPPKELLINKFIKILNTFQGQALHAKSLEFIHPISKKRLFFDSSLPKNFKKLILNIKN